MTILLPCLALGARRSMQWLVDVGELIPVAAISARSAYFMATAGRYGEAPCDDPMVYQMDADGELIAVFD
jgi:hypothetical protein